MINVYFYYVCKSGIKNLFDRFNLYYQKKSMSYSRALNARNCTATAKEVCWIYWTWKTSLRKIVSIHIDICLFQAIEDKSYLQDIKTLLSSISNGINVFDEIEESLTKNYSEMQSFVLLCGNKVVGVASRIEKVFLYSKDLLYLFVSAVREGDNLDYLKAQYDIATVVNPKMYFSHRYGVIQNAVASPIFRKHTNYFLREIHRLSQFDVLCYKLLPQDTSDFRRTRPLCSFLPNMLHIMPRKRPEYDLKTLENDGTVIYHRESTNYLLPL